MTAKSLCLWIRAAVVITALCGLAFCVYLLPGWVGWPTLGGYRPALAYCLFLWAAAAPCFVILWLAWLVAGDVRREEAFTVRVSKRVKAASLLLLIDAGCFMAGNVAFCALGHLPVRFLFEIALVAMFGVSLALLAMVLSRFIMKAAVLREENEGTI